MGEGFGYAYGWGIGQVSQREFIMHGGGINGFNTFALRYPAQEVYVVVLSNVDTVSTQAIAEGLAAIVLGDPYEIPAQQEAVAVDTAIYEKYVGSYQMADGQVLSLVTEADQLFVQTPDQTRIELLPRSETDYFANVAELQVHFQVSADGAVTGFIAEQGGEEFHAEKIN
jgi:hypothetical protein